jgi:glucose/arabinose dehydrogenase
MRKAFVAALLASLCTAPVFAAEPDNLILPPGFHASIVAEGIPQARHMAIRVNGDIYISTRHAGTAASAGLVALHLGPDHRVIETQHFTDIDNGTGIRIDGDKLYASSPTNVYRFDLPTNGLAPTAPPQVVIDGIPSGGQLNRILALDGKGGLFLSVAGTGNLCTAPDAPRDAKPVGLKPALH